MTAFLVLCLALVGVAWGWASDDAALLILGWFAVLLSFGLFRDVRRNHHALFDREEM